MPSFKYRPNHPEADENGMVPSYLAYNYTPGRAPSVISDEMPETRHMADGKRYTSKHKFREATRAAGCIEVGNEVATVTKARKPIELDRNKRRDDIRRAVYDIRNGNVPR